MKYLIVGLGNIGPEYELSRHNAGFLVLDRLADLNKTEFKTSRLAFTSDFRFKGKTVHLIKPTTYMNLSGRSVNYWMQKLQVPLENLLIVVDDLALPFGKLRLRAKGSSAGHNGLNDIEQHIGTQDYSRLRIGIGNNFSRGDQVNYVLSRFSEDEFKQLESILTQACSIITSFISVGIIQAMNEFNGSQQ